jgi:hypothetical protein
MRDFFFRKYSAPAEKNLAVEIIKEQKLSAIRLRARKISAQFFVGALSNLFQRSAKKQ